MLVEDGAVELQRRYRFGLPFLAAGIFAQTLGYTLPGDGGHFTAWGLALAMISGPALAAAAAKPSERREIESAIMFRIGTEWLALPTLLLDDEQWGRPASFSACSFRRWPTPSRRVPGRLGVDGGCSPGGRPRLAPENGPRSRRRPYPARVRIG